MRGGNDSFTSQRKHYSTYIHIYRENINKKPANYATNSRTCHGRHDKVGNKRLSIYRIKPCSKVVGTYSKVHKRIIFYETILTHYSAFRRKGNVHHWLGSSFFKRANTLSLRLRCNSATSLVLRAYLFLVLVMFNSYYYTRIPTICTINSIGKMYSNTVFILIPSQF